MKTQFLVLLFLASCAPDFSTKTTCGLSPPQRWEDGTLLDEDWMTLDTLRWAEDEILWHLERKSTDPRLNNRKAACSKLTQVKVWVHKDWNFGTPEHKFYGYAWCNGRAIEIGTPPDLDWRSTALTHEMLHIMQDCVPRLPDEDDQDRDHANWKTDGNYDAIEATWKR